MLPSKRTRSCLHRESQEEQTSRTSIVDFEERLLQSDLDDATEDDVQPQSFRSVLQDRVPKMIRTQLEERTDERNGFWSGLVSELDGRQRDLDEQSEQCNRLKAQVKKLEAEVAE